ncbi:Cell cycle checkpoint protein rad17 [Paramecium bursaria]
MLKFYSDKKVQAIKKYIKEMPKPILIIFGPSGSGKFTCVTEILKSIDYEYVYLSRFIKNDSFNKNANIIQQAMTLQLADICEKEAILLREAVEHEKPEQLRRIQSQYRNKRMRKPLILIINSQIQKDYHINRILGKEFVEKYCIIENFIPITNAKLSQLLRIKFSLKESSVQEIVQQANGDIGTATNLAYMNQIDQRLHQNIKCDGIKEGQSLFAILGKILYNKRIDQSGNIRLLSFDEMTNFPNAPYYFDPMHIISTLPIQQSTFRGFLHSNVIKFCPKLNDILEFNKTLCDIDVFEKCNLYNQRDLAHKAENDQLFSLILTLSYMEGNKHISEKQKQMTAIQGPLGYDLYRNQQIFKNNIGRMRPEDAQQIYQIQKRKLPPVPKMGQIYLQSDFTYFQEDDNQDQLKKEQKPEKIKKISSQVKMNGTSLDVCLINDQYNQHLNLLATRGFSLMEKGSYYLKAGEFFSNKTGVIGDILSRMICICTVLQFDVLKKKQFFNLNNYSQYRYSLSNGSVLNLSPNDFKQLVIDLSFSQLVNYYSDSACILGSNQSNESSEDGLDANTLNYIFSFFLFYYNL